MTTGEYFQYIINTLNEVVLVSIGILLILSWYYVIYFFNSLIKTKKLPKGKIKYKFAVLIPARNESKVIRNILESLKNQDYPREKYDVFVIVENEEDPTCNIVKEYGFDYIVRKNIEGRNTKGYALDDAYQYLESINYKCDAFMIFDADNILNKDYIDLMNDVKNKGINIGMGYRNFTNATTNWISACSATLFSFMNQFTSKGRSILFNKVTLTGTGYYIDYKIVHDAGGWIWNGMTEDVELTYYSYWHNIKMMYYNKAQYYDEQATKLSVLHTQHVRWVWGFFTDKRPLREHKELDYGSNSKFSRILGLMEYSIAIYPFLTFVIMQVLTFLIAFALFLASFYFCPEQSGWLFAHTILQFMWIYVTFMFVAFLTICIDNHHLKFNFRTKVAIIFTYMFFFWDFLNAFFDGLIHKEKRTSWKVIAHDGKVVDKQAKDTKNEKK